MNQENKEISPFRELSDTSSVVAHDLCAQLHVLQFCLEELEEHINQDGREYLKRMSDSTHYISKLVDSFRRGLKVSINDHDSFPLGEIYEGAIELIKNHYFVVLEQAILTSSKLNDVKVKDSGRKLLQMIFTFYSFFMDEIKAADEDKRFNLNFELHVKSENSRFARLILETQGKAFEQSWLREKIESSMAEKGKLRQFLGVTLIREKLQEDPRFIEFTKNDRGNTLSLLIPLEH
ncbi:MAG: hypothetical protein K9K67_06140 [Bacteriovoracaceae bacterium]|nr:hypothetical protein [Bacteriovoracaceae bacterium]